MWGNFLEKGRELAEKAKAAAATLDKQLNESVGVVLAETPTAPPAFAESSSTTVDDEALNDAWDDDDINIQDDKLEAQPETAKAPSEQVHTTEEPTEFAAVEPSTHQDGELQGGDDDEGWDDENIQFEEVQIHTDHDDNQIDEQHPTLASVDKDPVVGSAVSHDGPHSTSPSSTGDNESKIDEPSREKLAISETATSSDEKQSEPNMERQDGEAKFIDQDQSGWEGADDQVDFDDDAIEQDQTDLEMESRLIPDEETLLGLAQPEPTLHNLIEAVEVNALEIAGESQSIATSETDNNQEPTISEPQTKATSLPSLQDAMHRQKGAEQEDPANHELLRQVQELQALLFQRETQLLSKTDQLTTMQAMFDAEKSELLQKIQETKDEAKKRVQKARERVEAMEERLKSASVAQSSSAEDYAQQAKIIEALRSEGEKLAMKQAEMEKAVRAAKGEVRELREQIEKETDAKEAAKTSVAKLQAELTATKSELAAARKGESQADKLDHELRNVREDCERQATQILSLEQKVKELTANNKDLLVELEAARKGAVVETERELKRMRKEQSDALSDMENKLRISEREAALREDSLRHEISELRKRWQDAVRRADALAVDVQSSSAPLLRQLESMEKQSRARAAAWGELETKLRSELEENVIINETLQKERNEWKTKFTRLERSAKGVESELKEVKASLEEKTARVAQLEEKLQQMDRESAKMKEEWQEVEKLANEGVARVRSEMARTVVELEERHRTQLKNMDAELRQERDARAQLEAQNKELAEKFGRNSTSDKNVALPAAAAENDGTKQRLRKSEGQHEILAGALNGLSPGEIENEEEFDDVDQLPNTNSSFAAIEQLNSQIKASKVELKSLRKSLEDSEKSRNKLIEELAEARYAKEKLPLLEATVAELTTENRDQALEIQGLRDDIAEVRDLYRTQLNLLIEEKAAEVTVEAERQNLSEVGDNQVS